MSLETKSLEFLKVILICIKKTKPVENFSDGIVALADSLTQYVVFWHIGLSTRMMPSDY